MCKRILIPGYDSKPKAYVEKVFAESKSRMYKKNLIF